jgi:hypothetical protein
VSAQILIDEDGTRTVQLSDRDGLVVMHFEKPVRWCALDPATAARFAEACARAAYKAVAGDTPTTQAKSQVTEQIRVRLVARVELMLRTFEGEAPRPELKVQASNVVDACMKELA